ncbi:hypothetical protein V1511DRAFT_477320 [Dipodascopsis uninucleata]
MEEITDPSDWNGTKFQTFSVIDSLLRCRICQDFYNGPVIADCTHTFCSLCIRKSIASTPKSEQPTCPICRTNIQEVRLKKNQCIEEVVEWFRSQRKTIIELAASSTVDSNKDCQEQNTSDTRQDYQPTSKRRRKDINEEVKPGIDLRRSARNGNNKISYEEIADTNTECENNEHSVRFDSDICLVRESTSSISHISDNTDQTSDLVACPVCQKKMTEEQVMTHIDSCLSGQELIKSKRSAQPTLYGVVTVQSPPSKSQTRQRIPKIQYSLLNDSRLRNKLTELGIPSHGSKMDMQRRHTEWVTMWNANVDSANPKSKSQLLRELNEWERSITRPLNQKVADDDLGMWAKVHSNDFNELIAAARKSIPKRSLETVQTSASTSALFPSSTTPGTSASGGSSDAESESNSYGSQASEVGAIGTQ